MTLKLGGRFKLHEALNKILFGSPIAPEQQTLLTIINFLYIFQCKETMAGTEILLI